VSAEAGELQLARSGPISTRRGWRFEPKMEGYRCLVCTHAGFRARSRRGWNMTALLPELATSLPADVQLDGELVALDQDAHPDFHRLARRMLRGDKTIPFTYIVFDVLALDGEPRTHRCRPFLFAGRRIPIRSLGLELCVAARRAARFK
jgi:ATP-dependent DNA ligase